MGQRSHRAELMGTFVSYVAVWAAGIYLGGRLSR